MTAAPAAARAFKPAEKRSSEKRSHQRYPIKLEAEYKLVNDGRVEGTGVGRTLNISSTGVLFETSDTLHPGRTIELSLSWPFLLEGVCPLKLITRGSIVRCDGKKVAVRFKNYEFRTAGARARKAPASPNRVRSIAQ